MKIKWNPTEYCFESEFQDFQNDLAAVKAAGFKTTGPPNWIWFTKKIEPLDKLRANRPASGLTIFEDALDQYNRIKSENEKRDALLAELKSRKAKKPAERKERTESIPDGQEFGYNYVENSEPKNYTKYKPSVWTGPICIICKQRVDFFEKQNPPTCLWCEISLDDEPELF